MHGSLQSYLFLLYATLLQVVTGNNNHPMKVFVKWVLTGNISEFEEKDDLLGPQTSILELKGFIQIKFGFAAKDIVLIYQHLLENHRTLREIGIVDQDSATRHVLTAHIIRSGAKLEKSKNLDGTDDDHKDDDDDDTTHDDDLQFFTHEDFILAMKMLGKDVPVSSDRISQVRAAAPRSRPAFLNTVKAPTPAQQQQQPPAFTGGGLTLQQEIAIQAPSSSGPPAPESNAAQQYHPRQTRLHQIFARSEYGLRKEHAEAEFAIHYPSVADPYQYWDMRLPEKPELQDELCSINEVCLELFFFGEHKFLVSEKFLSLVRQLLETKLGLKVRTPRPAREAGCMYPLVAVAIVVTELEGTELGHALFEDFGTAPPSQYAEQHQQSGAVAGKPTKASACGQQ